MSAARSGRATVVVTRRLPAPVEEQLAKKMEDAGFSNVTWTSLSFGVAAIHVGERPISSIGAK